MNFFSRIKERTLSVLLPKLRPYGYYAVRSIFEDLKTLVVKENPIIVDVGANIGETTDKFLSQYGSPTIYSYEANPNLKKLLESKFGKNKNVHIILKALGNKESNMVFNVAKNNPSSSFLPRAELNKIYHGGATATEKEISIPMTKLANEFPEQEIDILKLDVEGYELEILKGAETILPRIKIIMSEVWFAKYYEDGAYFSEVEDYLRRHDFILLNIYNPYTHKDMQLTTADAVFLNNKFFKNRKNFG